MSLSANAGEFWKSVYERKLFEDRGGVYSIRRSEGKNNMKSNNGIAEGND